MAVRDKAALEAQIAALLLNNTTGEISPADLRSVLGDVADSLAFETALVPDGTPH